MINRNKSFRILSFLAVVDRLNYIQACSYLSLQTSLLADIGGANTEDFIKRTMRFLLSDLLARQFNFSGRGKRSFGSLVLSEVLFRKYHIICCYSV